MIEFGNENANMTKGTFLGKLEEGEKGSFEIVVAFTFCGEG